MNNKNTYEIDKNPRISLLNSFHKLLIICANKLHSNSFFSIHLSILIENLIASIKGYSVRFSYDKKEKLIITREGKLERCFKNINRGFWLYRNGIKTRGEFLFNSYCLNNIYFKEGDVIIDCGANAGDLFIKFNDMQKSISYIGIEPNPEDFEVLKKNVDGPNTILLNKGVGEKNNMLPFYISTDLGDSSLIEPVSYTNIIEIEVITLDNIIDKYNLEKVKLLKLETEGYEIEALKGLVRSINNIEYIAVDGGYERGVDAEETFTWISNYLINNNFEMIGIYFDWCRALFKNTQINN